MAHAIPSIYLLSTPSSVSCVALAYIHYKFIVFSLKHLRRQRKTIHYLQEMVTVTLKQHAKSTLMETNFWYASVYHTYCKCHFFLGSFPFQWRYFILKRIDFKFVNINVEASWFLPFCSTVCCFNK